jgi:hypothetical protein
VWGSKLAAAAAIAACFFYFAGEGLRADFTHDDLMNLYVSWRAPAGEHLRDIALFFRPSASYRPAGALFYRALFESFGFNALPFRIACFALMLANLWLAYALLRRLAGSRATAALATLVFAYHGQFWCLYVNTGMCYDLLCFFFYAAAFLYYLRAREQGLPLGWGRVAVWSALYILCLNSKEMAVTLPVMIAVHELLAGERLAKAWRVPAAGAAITALFIFGRVTAMFSNAGYRPSFGPRVYLEHAYRFLGFALYDPWWLMPWVAAALALAVAAYAAWRGSPALRLAVVWMAIGILPVAFIEQRGLDAVYIPALALALAIALAIPRRRPAVAFAAVLAVLVLAHHRYGRVDYPVMLAEGHKIRAVYEQMRARRFPAKSRVLFLQDPFPNDQWSSAFLVYLVSKDRSLQVARADYGAQGKHDVVLSYEGGRLVERAR